MQVIEFHPFLILGTINRRIHRLSVRIKDDNNKNINLDNGIYNFSIDSTGIEVTNRGHDWMNKKWNMVNKERTSKNSCRR